MFVIDRNLMPTPAVVTHAAFSLESLVAWLETMPPEQTYCYYSEGDCLWGKYTSEHGGQLLRGERGYVIGGTTFRNDLSFRGGSRRFAVARTHPWTFGAALLRARSYLASEVQS